MKELPSCLLKRYRALDEVIRDLRSVTESRSSNPNCECGCKSDRGLKLMCEFWNMLKDDSNSNPKKTDLHTVPQRSGVEDYETHTRPQCTTCYMARGKKSCKKCGETKNSCKEEPPIIPTPISSVTDCGQSTPICSVLCNFEEAANFDQKCSDKLKELMETEQQLKDAIKKLEEREKESIRMLREADVMWMSMEDTYKKKMVETFERQKLLEKELRGVETSTKKWRENMKELEGKIEKVDKYRSDVKDKTSQKTNDIKYLDTEIKDLQNRLENNKKEIEATKKSMVTKREATDKKIAKYREDIKNLEKVVAEENKTKKEKEFQGSKIIKEARDDLQKICGVLLKKKLENEDLRAERAALSSEIELLLQARDKCRDKCDLRQKSIENQIQNLDKDIHDQQTKCSKCNQCTDTVEINRFCSDCPKCLEERSCALLGDHCGIDHTMDCICTTVKRKFLDNVFENMYTVLERQIKKGSGKAVAEQILECLKRSRNGKLDDKTRKMLQEFILTAVKKHLNLTIVGGAVKTRCELDPDMYRQLMICLQKVQVSKPEKVDKGTISKKAPCYRWGGTSECNCPKGPKDCICTKKSPPAPHDPSPCPVDDDYEDDNKKLCPYKDKRICGPECGKEDEKFKQMMNEISKARCDTCSGSTCKMSKNMRTATCVLEPEISSTIPTRDSNIPKPKLKPHQTDQRYCDCFYPASHSKYEQDTKKLNKSQRAVQTTCPITISLNDCFLKIAKTPSGASVLEFDKDFLKVLENESKLHPPSSTKLIITDSGQILIEFKSEFYRNSSIDRMMKLKKVIPGCLFFKGNKNVSELIEKSVDKMPQVNINLHKKDDQMQPNAVLRKTQSGIVLIIATEPLEQVHKRLLALLPDTYTKLKVLQNDDSVYDFPGVLKSTPSRNYILAIDKEFEKCLKATVKNIIKDDSTAILTLRKSESGSHLVKFGCCKTEPQTEIGILKKTRSGNIKILSNAPCDLSLVKKVISGSEEAMKLSKCCKELVLNIPKTKFYQVTNQLYNIYENQFSSSKKPEKLTKQNQVGKSLGKTPLYKDLKANFIKNIKSFLDSSKSLPIKSTVSDSIILFVRRRSSKAPILLKFTRSSNIYVSKLKKRSIKDVASVNSSHLHNTPNRQMENKLVGTKTIVQNENDSCDLLEFDSNMTMLYHEVSRLIQPETIGTMKSSSKDIALTIRGKRNSIKSDKTRPHIVIKPTSGMSCVYHNSEFNELSELGSRNIFDMENKNKANEEVGNSENEEDKKRCWDSLRFLPPQLPSFLGEVVHMYN
ncbi:PREDICTED: uncharacterized protein LOC106122291 isoform X2 [Papilio xuthus]|uniref:Uncharacterized protein LOC106122291 isoform X2 n=1 Tax=Papilio xuthus TaxID=66420 RepID=A0AAJ6ZJK4_PAPXU|nr:PREDICTED: uncharacterized protein LOC106122291 isoform X2 [Papilio xuthus]